MPREESFVSSPNKDLVVPVKTSDNSYKLMKITNLMDDVQYLNRSQ